MSHAKVNLRELPDMAREHGLAQSQEARFARSPLQAESTGITYLKVKPGQREAFAHRHAEAEEVLVVLSGSGSVKLDEELVALAPYDAVRVSPTVTRRLQADADGLEVLIVGRHVSGDAEIVNGFWEE
jgi:uncharacterized cupin superfamily protein